MNIKCPFKNSEPCLFCCRIRMINTKISCRTEKLMKPNKSLRWKKKQYIYHNQEENII